MLTTRLRQVASTAVLGSVANVVRVLATLVTVPSLLTYLGQDRFGLWILSLSLMGVLGFAYSGTAGAIVTAVSRSLRDPLHDAVRLAVTSAMTISVLSGLFCTVAGLLICSLVDLPSLLGVRASVSAHEVTTHLATMALLLGVGFPANVPKFVLIGSLRGGIAYSIELAGVISATCLLLISITFRQPLYILALAFLGPQYLLMFFLGRYALSRHSVPLFSRRYFVWRDVIGMFREGSKLALSQASFAIASHTDLTLISVIAGAGAAVPYGLAQRVFGAPIMFLAVANDALWPALARADANGERRWVRTTYLRTLISMGIVSSVASSLIWTLYGPLTKLWLGAPIATSPLLLGGMAALVVATMMVHTTAMLLRSVGQTTILMRAMMAMMLVNVPASIALIHFIGAAGAVWGTVISYAICLIAPFIWIVPRILKQRENDSASERTQGSILSNQV
ncbi:polysaccharide biosynthesis C-terminal domain-containing protein [Mesorhizobium sp. M0208]|uniref:lipopolysaccharide biosynthesis protein n=1 Tax=Mesorhizobium sp. M0208 TaxID=2956916 RepID=UPI00333B6277